MSIKFYTKQEYVGKANVTSYYAVSEEAFLLLRINDQVPDQVETNYCPGKVNLEKLEPIQMASFCNLLLAYYLKIAVAFNLRLVFDQEAFATAIYKELADGRQGSLAELVGRVQTSVKMNLMLITRDAESSGETKVEGQS